ncbi:MAG: amidohydrolase [Planctomycetes bacterium]|nr:amidohydrolase [Planctomycetota bacterium]MCW8135031.1 amidohydrolase [Planctomycetota bacterium]
MAHELLAAAQQLQDYLTTQRRTLHMMPELSLHEFKTSEHCAHELSKLGLKVSKPWGEGLIADIDGPNAKGRIALRADMDALPIHELNDIPYRSKHDGVAHMCGHDTHMAVLLGTAKLLAGMRDRLRHNVRLLFQPSEELPPGGAPGMIEKGALEGVDEVYGLHNLPALEVGQVATCTGAMTAAADIFEIKLTGKGGHASRPQETLDPIPAACELVGMLQTLVSRRVAPFEQAVLSVTKVKSGTTHNIIPDDAELMGTVRTYEEPVRARIIEEMRRMVSAVAQAHGLQGELHYLRGYDSIVNHESGAKRVAQAAAEIVGKNNVDPDYQRQTWGEDFAYYLQKKPGAFFLLGSGNKAKGIVNPVHSARFNVDEACLPIGVAVMAKLAL